MSVGLPSIHSWLARVKSLIALAIQKLPSPVYSALKDVDRALEMVELRGEARATPPSTTQKLKAMVEIATGLQKTVLFYPQMPKMPTSYYKAKILSAAAGFKIINDPTRPYDVSFQFEDVTVTAKSDIEEDINLESSVNGKCLDISKKKVSETFEDVFGYSMTIEPRAYDGPAVKKSNENGTHDGIVIDCPIPNSAVEEGKVYQKLIDTRTEEGFFLNYRIAVCGDIVPLVLIMYRPSDDRFDGCSHEEVASIEEVFTQSERTKLSRFVRAMNLDYGELDVLRSNGDGRIYVVDVNNTPATTTVGEDAGHMEDYKVKWRQALASSFEDMICRFAKEA